jgi:hypothetical protein
VIYPVYESAQWADQAAWQAALAVEFEANSAAYCASSDLCAERASVTARAIGLERAAP